MSRLDDLIKKIVIGSTAILTATNNNLLGNEKDHNKQSEDLGSNINIEQKKLPYSKPRLILKQADSPDSWYFASHRSHRSHSSHRSHYSHYSSRTGGSPSTQSPKTTTHNLGSRILKKGMTGNDVKELKKILNDRGYNIEPDETFGELTEIIIKDFQSKNSMTIDGEVGPITLYYLKNNKSNTKINLTDEDKKVKNVVFGSRNLVEGLKGSDVLELEKKLSKLKYQIKPDNNFDEFTTAIVKEYQIKNGIPADGIVGPLTFYYLNKY